jgi:hypothetical protein
MRHKGVAHEEGSKMNSRDRNGLYGGGNIMPCGSERKCDSRSSRIGTTRAVASSEIDLITVSRPKKARSAYARMRYAKIVSMLVICAAATIVVSAIAHASVDTEKVAAPAAPAPGAPGTPYFLTGYTTDALGNPVECNITVINLRTLEVNTTNSYIVPPWPLDGYYEIDLANSFPSGVQDGDLINVTAIDRTVTTIGWNESAVPGGGFMSMDVTLTGTAIPEFPMVIVPVTGMLALFAVVALSRRGEEQ